MYWFADFETATSKTNYYKTTGDTTLIIGGLMNEWGSQYYEYTNLDDFLKLCFKYIRKSDKLFFHNLTWDGNFIFKHCFKTGWRPVNSIQEVQHKCLYMFRNKSNIYQIVLGWMNKRIDIRCSYKLLCAGIDNLAKSIGLKSKDEFIQENSSFYDLEPVKYVHQVPWNMREYLKNDIKTACLGIQRFFKSLREELKDAYDIFDLDDFLTTGSLSFNLQKYFTEKQIDASFFKCTKDEHDLAKQFFFGGLTQFNPTIQRQLIQPENGGLYDINSAYPYAMTKPLPIKQLIDFEEEFPDASQDYYVYLHMRIGTAIAKYKETPFLRDWTDENPDFRYVHTLENFECFYLEQEFEVLEKFYEFQNVEIIKSYWAPVQPFLKEYVEHFYKLKNNFKQKNDAAGGLAFKILLNAGYGKHAQRPDIKSEFWVKDEDKEKLLTAGRAKLSKRIWSKKHGKYMNIAREYYTFRLTKLTEMENVQGMSNIAILPTEIKAVNNMLLASTITALNRVYLMENIYNIGVKNFLYCDTDSIFVSDKTAAEKVLKIDKEELGAWDCEMSFDTFIVLGAKAYCAKTKNKEKMKFSGVNKRFLEKFGGVEWYDGSTTVLFNANLEKLETKSGLVLIETNYEIKARNQ